MHTVSKERSLCCFAVAKTTMFFSTLLKKERKKEKKERVKDFTKEF